MAALRAGQWRGAHMGWGHDPQGKTLGIVGMGGIGQAMARRARAFGMRIVYHNRHRLPPATEAALQATAVELDALYATADVVSLCLAYAPEARHMLDGAAFARMKRGVTVVNTARGRMVDEAALLAALNDGIVWAAGLDVFEEEPAVHSRLLADERVFLTPHLAAGTIETYLKMEGLALANVAAALTEGRLVTQVREQLG
jgi:glyoxylate reductase